VEEKKPEEKQDKPQSLIFGASTIPPISGGLFGTTTPAPATGGLFGTPAATKPPTSIFDVLVTKPAESGKELPPSPEKKSIHSVQELS
jgi:hypothetical protein